jgi:hypothetical protein
LVKVSYFPNWKVSGGEGPYRVTPNLMVVVPTSTHVKLHYGYVGVDYLANALTLFGLIALFWLFRARVEEEQRVLWDPIGRWFRRRPHPDKPDEMFELERIDEPNRVSEDVTVDVGVTDSRLE